jgi:hypothetical protein
MTKPRVDAGSVFLLEIRNIGCLATPLGSSARRGRAQGEVLRIRHAAVRAENGRLVFVGTESDYAREFAGRRADTTLDAAGRAAIPVLVDAHTHPVWLGDRGGDPGVSPKPTPRSPPGRDQRDRPRHPSRHGPELRDGRLRLARMLGRTTTVEANRAMA